MSMRNYSIVHYGVVVKPDELNLEAIGKESNENLTVEEVCEWLDEEEISLQNGGDIMSKALLSTDIEGEFFNLFTQEESDISVMHDNWFFFDLPKYPSFFRAVYKDKDDMIRQVKEMYGSFILDENFDWENRLVCLNAVIYS